MVWGIIQGSTERGERRREKLSDRGAAFFSVSENASNSFPGNRDDGDSIKTKILNSAMSVGS